MREPRRSRRQIGSSDEWTANHTVLRPRWPVGLTLRERGIRPHVQRSRKLLIALDVRRLTASARSKASRPTASRLSASVS